MNSNIVEDPLFQLNLMLWATISRPELSSASAALTDCGYLLRSIGYRLTAGMQLRAHFLKEFGNTDGPSPDLILENVSGHPWLIVECKANSFSERSSTANQAKKLLMIASEIREALALPDKLARAIVVYTLPSVSAARQLETLEMISQELRTHGIDTAPFGVFSIDIDDNTIGLCFLAKDDVMQTVPPVLSGRIRILDFEKGDDPRPLYLIPFDPSISQSDDEGARSKNLLLQRTFSQVVSEISKTKIPERITIDARDVLRTITFGVSASWRGHEHEGTAELMASSIENEIRHLNDRCDVRVEGRTRVSLTVPTIDTREQLIDALLKAKPSSARMPIDERQQQLFDL